jgi:hypothetical protein
MTQWRGDTQTGSNFMILKHKSQQKRNDSSKSSQKTKHNLSAHKLTLPPINAYPVPVDSKSRQTAKFWDSYPSKGGNTATRKAVFLCLYDAQTRLMPGMRGLQDGENRNKRVVSVRTITVPGNICPK